MIDVSCIVHAYKIGNENVANMYLKKSNYGTCILSFSLLVRLNKDKNWFPLTISDWNRLPQAIVLSCLVETWKTFTLYILYCSINNWIRHTFHNLETFSPLLSNSNWLNLLTVLTFSNCHVQPLTQWSACRRQSVFGRSRRWRMLGFCLSEYCDFTRQGIQPAMSIWRKTCAEIY